MAKRRQTNIAQGNVFLSQPGGQDATPAALMSKGKRAAPFKGAKDRRHCRTGSAGKAQSQTVVGTDVQIVRLPSDVEEHVAMRLHDAFGLPR
jgi:hypothetical protein